MTGRSFALLLLSLFAGSSASAHTLSVAHVDVTVPADGGDLSVELDLALRDIALTLPLDRNGDERVTWGELQAVRQPLQALVASRLSFSSGAGACTPEFRGLATRRYDDGGYATLLVNIRCPSLQALSLHYRLMFDKDPQHRALVTVRRNGQVTTLIARADSPRLALASDGQRPFLDFLAEGMHHIALGYDHLAFLVCLLLPAPLVRAARQWRPSGSGRNVLWRVLGIVTAFTLAHSITLSLAALGWVTPASRCVEVLIAASVLLAALNNLFPLVDRKAWLVAFAFGLVHGFGFASALMEIGLPAGARLLALFGFNAGVELGQLAVVTVLLPLLLILRRRSWYPKWILAPASVMIGLLAAVWLAQRLGG